MTTLVQASDFAVRNHQGEKIQALRNAVVNSALGVNIDDDLQLTFIRYINELTPSHFSLLTFFREQEQTFKRVESYEDLFQSFASNNPDLNIKREEFKLLCNDLTARVLLRISRDVEDFDDIGSHDLIWQERGTDKPRLRVTAFGIELLDFITSNDTKRGDTRQEER